jgi:hypothetical protein
MSNSDSPSTLVPKLLFTRREASYALGISIRSLDYLVGAKQLAHRRLGKKVMIAAKELERFARADHQHLTQYPGRVQ